LNGFNEPGGNGLDLNLCDKEPIHIPGSIQPHGLLLVLDPVQLTILQASGNSCAFTGRDVAQLLGQTVEPLLGGKLARQLRDWADGKGSMGRIVLEAALDHRLFTCVAHRSSLSAVILELEPTVAHHDSLFHHVYRCIEAAIPRFEDQATMPQLLQSAAEQARALTGFDRVMVYQFREDHSGAVVAEDRAEGFVSWMGLHFPASDIPAQARALYVRSRIRSIPDIDYVPVPIVSPAGLPRADPLDLSHASLRSVAPIHIEYLRTMRVAASMSVSIVRGGRLWGLIACHHRTPRHTPPEVRFACDFLAQTLSMLIGAEEESTHLQNAAGLRSSHSRLMREISEQRSVLKDLAACPDAAMAVANASGVALCTAEQCSVWGQTPALEEVSRLVAWLAQRDDRALFVTDSLPASFPDAGAHADRAAGILAVALSREEPGYLVWFRPEILREVRWAGNPEKPVELADPTSDGPRGLCVYPRKSFEIWKQSVSGKSSPWMTWEVEAAQTLAKEVARKLVLERAAAESAGRQAAEAERDRLREAAAAMEQVLSIIGHELRTPLASIGAMADLLLEPQARQMPAFDAHLSSITTEISRMSDTVNDLVESARLASGHRQWEWAVVSLTDVCSEALADVRPGVDPVVVELRLALESRDLSMSGDHDALRRMLVGLLHNAREHTPRGSIELQCGQRLDACGRWIEFFVTDTGEGIAPELAGRLGSAFALNAGVVGINAIQGSGLGLAICNGIAVGHGGGILIESTPGLGTRVSIRVRADLPGPATLPGDAPIATVISSGATL
jgi:chemotaxis family two-component system sensor kinase Cph1